MNRAQTLTARNNRAYTIPVAAKSATGFDSLNQLESTPHLLFWSAVFLCSEHGTLSVMGRAVWEAFGPAGPVAGLSTRAVPPSLIDSRVAVQKADNWSIANA